MVDNKKYKNYLIVMWLFFVCLLAFGLFVSLFHEKIENNDYLKILMLFFMIPGGILYLVSVIELFKLFKSFKYIFIISTVFVFIPGSFFSLTAILIDLFFIPFYLIYITKGYLDMVKR